MALKLSATPGHSSMPPAPGRERDRHDERGPQAPGRSATAGWHPWRDPRDVRDAGAGDERPEPCRAVQPVAVRAAGARAAAGFAQHQRRAADHHRADHRPGRQQGTTSCPGRAEATVNFRLLPGDSASSVIAHVEHAVRSAAPRGISELAMLPGVSEAAPVSPTQSASYQLINRTVRELFPGTVVAPGLMVGATDSRHMVGISDHVFRFSPVRAKPADLACFHGTDERISEMNLVELIRFYHRLIHQAAGMDA
nr:M20/M25/M40 family metallo-hydrolase [Ralstonia syzygii]